MSSPQILSSYRSQTWQIWEPRIIVILSHLQNCWWEMQMNHFHSAICVFNGSTINTHLSFANYTFPDKRGKKMKCEMRRITHENSRQGTAPCCQPGLGDFRWTQGFLSTWEAGQGARLAHPPAVWEHHSLPFSLGSFPLLTRWFPSAHSTSYLWFLKWILSMGINGS